MESYGELWRDTEIYSDVWLKIFLIKLHMTRQKLRRAMESYGDIGIGMVRNFL